MQQLPDRAPTDVGQPTSNPLTDSVIEAAVRDAIHQTSHRDDTPLPAVGTTPPVPQPGRPPMSQGATDVSVVMLSAGATSLLVGGGVSLVMLTSGYADPTVCGIVFGAPAVLTLAVGRLLKRAKGVLPPDIHNHFSGTIHQDQRDIHTKNIGVWARTNNR